MAITKERKVAIVENLKERLTGVPAVVFVNFHGLSVAKATTLRKALGSQKVGFTVAKKTLIRRALEARGFEGEVPELTGEVALAYPEAGQAGDDAAIAPARGVYEFEKANKEAVKILGGVFEGKYVPAAVMIEIASIPGREVLLGRLANILNSPIQRFVMALDQISKTKQA